MACACAWLLSEEGSVWGDKLSMVEMLVEMPPYDSNYS